MRLDVELRQIAQAGGIFGVLLTKHCFKNAGYFFGGKYRGGVVTFTIKFARLCSEFIDPLKASLIFRGAGYILLCIADGPLSILGSIVRFAVKLLGDDLLTPAIPDDWIIVFLRLRDLA